MNYVEQAVQCAIKNGYEKEEVLKLKTLLERVDGSYEEFVAGTIDEVTDDKEWFKKMIAFLEEYDGADTDDVEMYTFELQGIS